MWRRAALGYRTVKHFATRGRRPSKRRAAIWRARAAFYQAAARLSPTDVAIDAGANLGDFTLHLARRGAKVHAFEPDPHPHEVLSNRFSSYSNVVIHRAAVGTAAGVTELYRSAAFTDDPDLLSQSSSVIVTKPDLDTSTAIPVDVVDFADFIANHGPIKLLKMDIEGAEAAVLQQLLHRGLLSSIPHIFVEAHDRKIPEIRQLMHEVREEIRTRGLGNVNLDWA